MASERGRTDEFGRTAARSGTGLVLAAILSGLLGACGPRIVTLGSNLGADGLDGMFAAYSESGDASAPAMRRLQEALRLGELPNDAETLRRLLAARGASCGPAEEPGFTNCRYERFRDFQVTPFAVGPARFREVWTAHLVMPARGPVAEQARVSVTRRHEPI